MKLRRCVGCGLPVLELDGQFAMLDSYYLDGGGPLLESSGEWHAACLAASGLSEAWFEARYRNFVQVRGYRELGDFGESVGSAQSTTSSEGWVT